MFYVVENPVKMAEIRANLGECGKYFPWKGEGFTSVFNKKYVKWKIWVQKYKKL